MPSYLRHGGAVLVLAAALTACGGDDDSADLPATTVTTTASVDPGTTASSRHTTVTPTSTARQPGSEPSSPDTDPSPPTTAPITLINVADERLAFTLALPDEHPVTNTLESDFAGDGSCIAPVWQLAGGITVEAWPASCDPANAEPGNGSFGHYRTIADAPAPIDPMEVDTVLGPAEVFGQIYYECTNSCQEWELDIAVITLSEPVNGEYPTLTVIGTQESYSRADLLAVLESFGAG